MTNLRQNDVEYAVLKEAALVISLISNCLNLVGFVSTAWAIPVDREIDPNFEGLGLWRFCTHYSDTGSDTDVSTCYNTVDLSLPAWFKATQAMMAMGFSVAVVALFALIASECVKSLRRDVTALFVALGLAFAGTVFNTLGVIIFGASLTNGEQLMLPDEPEGMRYDVSWSYTICAVAAVFSTFSSVCLVIEYVNNKTRRYSRHLGQGLTNPVHEAQASSGGGRLDRSFTPYTSFPDLENVETNGSVVDADATADVATPHGSEAATDANESDTEVSNS